MTYYIHTEDPYPGRCRNYRQGRDRYGNPESRRCLDYEHKPHTCSFEPDPPRIELDHSWTSSVYQKPKPVPWVKPGDEPEGDT